MVSIKTCFTYTSQIKKMALFSAYFCWYCTFSELFIKKLFFANTFHSICMYKTCSFWEVSHLFLCSAKLLYRTENLCFYHLHDGLYPRIPSLAGILFRACCFIDYTFFSFASYRMNISWRQQNSTLLPHLFFIYLMARKWNNIMKKKYVYQTRTEENTLPILFSLLGIQICFKCIKENGKGVHQPTLFAHLMKGFRDYKK